MNKPTQPGPRAVVTERAEKAEVEIKSGIALGGAAKNYWNRGMRLALERHPELSPFKARGSQQLGRHVEFGSSSSRAKEGPGETAGGGGEICVGIWMCPN